MSRTATCATPLCRRCTHTTIRCALTNATLRSAAGFDLAWSLEVTAFLLLWSTFMGCAAALASLAVIEEGKLVARAAETGERALAHLRSRCGDHPALHDVRGIGLLLALELERAEDAERTCAGALARGVISLRSGDDGRVIAIHPPLGIDADLLCLALDLLVESLP